MRERPLLAVRFTSRGALAPILRAALDEDVVFVTLNAPPPMGQSTLQLWVGAGLVAAVVAEPVGSGGPTGEYPLRVGPLDPEHVPELEALSKRVSMLPPDPVLVDLSAPGDDEQTMPRDAVQPGDERARVHPRSSWNVRKSPTNDDPLCGRAIGGNKYVLESVIGTGAIGIVFKALHRELGRTVAIKVLNPRWQDEPEAMAVFHSEARAASLLEHPNVARLYDYGQERDGLVYIVMEYLSGYTLGSVLEARHRLTLTRAVDVMLQVCSALSAAHDRGIVHRDVKPDNVVLVPAQDDEGKPVEIVKVCDFGIAALGTPRESAVAAGTPEYMSPEQATGSAITPAADVYACGVVLYEMLTGQVPFRAERPYQILMKHANDPPRPPSELVEGMPPALEAVVLRSLEKAPLRRYQSARELRIELRKAV